MRNCENCDLDVMSCIDCETPRSKPDRGPLYSDRANGETPHQLTEVTLLKDRIRHLEKDVAALKSRLQTIKTVLLDDYR